MGYVPSTKKWRDVLVQTKTSTTDGRGRTVPGWNPVTTFKGVIANCTPEEVERWKQLQHPITHQVVARGVRQAKEGDRLIIDTRNPMYIQKIDEPGDIGLWVIYYCEERKDA